MKRFIILGTLLVFFISFFSTKTSTGDNKDLIFEDKFLCNKFRKSDEKEVTRDKKLNFYLSANLGKIYYDSSELFINEIKEIGERIINSVESSYGAIAKNMLADEIKNIFGDRFDGKIDFRWLSSISLGFSAIENAQIDFETVYFLAKIKSGNSLSILDKSFSIFAFLLNLYYNLDIQDTQFTPYVGFGIGPAVLRFKKINISTENFIPLNVPLVAYQIKLGINYLIFSEVKALLVYRYFSIPIPVTDDISTHNIEVGFMFNF